MGIAHHSNDIVWFEIGRTDLCRATGFPYAEIEARGFILVVTEVACRFRIPFKYDDEVIVDAVQYRVAHFTMRRSHLLIGDHVTEGFVFGDFFTFFDRPNGKQAEACKRAADTK